MKITAEKVPKKPLLLRCALVAAPVILLAAAIMLRLQITALGNSLPKCIFRLLTGYACPGCGNTHAVLELLDGHLLSSLRYNVAPLVLCVMGILFYSELVCRAFGRDVKLLPRSTAFAVTLSVAFAVYTVVRNFIPFLIPFG